MIPTSKLRFVERNEPVILRGEKFDNWSKVLQQWWAETIIDEIHVLGFSRKTETVKGEWRDVPLEKEQ